MEKYDAVIIGSGLGGLLCGNILSREGFRVCLIERNHKLGGSLQTFGRKGCIFNTGLNYTESLDDGQILNQYFRYFGLMDKLTLERLDPGGFETIHFKDGQYKFAMGRENFIETLAGYFPSERAGLQQYANVIRDVCKGISLYTLNEVPISMMNNYDLSTGAADFIRSVIKDPRLQNIVAGNNLLYAGHESKTPLFIHALINHSFIESAWRVVDGSHQIVNILADNIISNGGSILRGSGVVKLKSEKNSITGVQLANGETVEGKHFIANIHPAQLLSLTEPGLMRKAFNTRISNLEDTMGMFTLYLVFKPGSFPYSKSNFYHYNQDNVWIASSYDASKWPQNYLFMHTSTSGSSGFSKSGSVITYMDVKELKQWESTFTGDRGTEYLEFKQARAEKLLDAVEQQFPEIRNCILNYYTSTPLTWRDYTGTRAGSSYGILKDCTRPLESMILSRTKVPNLFLTGQNTNVHGILGVTISAVITCAELIDFRYLVKKIKNA